MYLCHQQFAENCRVLVSCYYQEKNLFHNFRGSEQENLVELTQQRKTEDEFFIISNFEKN